MNIPFRNATGEHRKEVSFSDRIDRVTRQKPSSEPRWTTREGRCEKWLRWTRNGMSWQAKSNHNKRMAKEIVAKCCKHATWINMSHFEVIPELLGSITAPIPNDSIPSIALSQSSRISGEGEERSERLAQQIRQLHPRPFDAAWHPPCWQQAAGVQNLETEISRANVLQVQRAKMEKTDKHRKRF